MAVTLANAAPIAIQLTRRELYRGLKEPLMDNWRYLSSKISSRIDGFKEGPRLLWRKENQTFREDRRFACERCSSD